MLSIKNYIPNFITSLNLFSGCLACVFAFNGEFKIATAFLILAAVFDFMDGLFARLLKAYSELGKQLDSLADMVSFGVAPGIIIYSFLSFIDPFFAFIGFLIPIFSALRLAKFNIDTRQTSSFIGLPTPANAIFWAFLISYIVPSDFLLFLSPRSSSYIMIISAVLILMFCYLMVAELPMFALKFKNLAWKENKVRFLFLIASLSLLIVFQLSAFPAIIALYILMSIVSNLFGNKLEKIEK